MICWEALCSWLSNYKIGVQPFTLIDILFGVFNIGDDFSIINHLILTAKLCIYKCKLSNIHPNLRVYKANIKTVYLVEKKIARRRNKLIKHFKKWEKLLAVCRLVEWVSSDVSLLILCFLSFFYVVCLM